MSGHRRHLKQDIATHRATIKRSYIDAFGRDHNDGEFKHWMGGNNPSTRFMRNHVSWLAGAPAEYDAVYKCSSQFVFKRQPDAGELKYWRSLRTISNAMLVAAHDTWRKSNPTSPAQTADVSSVAAASTFLAALQRRVTKSLSMTPLLPLVPRLLAAVCCIASLIPLNTIQPAPGYGVKPVTVSLGS